MRLRLFEWLGRIVGWRLGSQGEGSGSGRSRDLHSAGAESGGKHRRSTGSGTGQPRTWTAAQGTGSRPPVPALPVQPPAGLPRRPAQPGAGPVSPASPAAPASWPANGRRAGTRSAGGAAPPMPRNYTPGPAGRPAVPGGIGRARIREAPYGAAPMETVTHERDGTHGQAGTAALPRQPWYQVVGGPAAAAQRASAPGEAASPGPQAWVRQAPRAAPAAELPRSEPHPLSYPVTADGRRHCGPIEAILWRQWDDAAAAPPPQVIAAIDRLAEFPRQLQEKLAAGLDGIYVGVGGVPDLDDMSALHGVQLPSGKATWDACAGAYGDRKIVVGTRPSPTPDVMCHEIGHALDDLDSPPGKWQSDSAEFRLIYDQCQPYIASDFHRQRGGLGRKEFFADSFAAIASAQRPALVDMLGGHTRVALRVMLYFNRRYGI
jgi:hypothetical protein